MDKATMFEQVKQELSKQREAVDRRIIFSDGNDELHDNLCGQLTALAHLQYFLHDMEMQAADESSRPV